MYTTDPATRPTLAILQLRDGPFDVFLACQCLFDADSPTDPLIASERCQLLPYRQRRWSAIERSCEIRRSLVHRAVSNFLLCHRFILPHIVSAQSFLSMAAYGRAITNNR